MKLSVYAQKLGITYRTAWSYFQQGMIPGAYQTPTGTIVVPLETPQHEAIVDIMTFCYGTQFLNLASNNFLLHRSQSVVLKALYMGTVGNPHLTLSPDDWMWLKSNEEIGDFRATLDKLRYREKERNEGSTFRFNQLALFLGRRTGKTLLLSIIEAYEAYKLLTINHGDPHNYFNIPECSLLSILHVGQSLSIVNDSISFTHNLLRNSPFFANRVDRSKNRIGLMTDWDLHLKNEGARRAGSVEICGGSNSRSLRGRTAVCVVLDLYDDWQEHYDALKPTVTPFASKNAGLIALVGGPELYYQISDQALQPEDPTLLFRAPTWVFNPDLPETNPILAEMKKTNPDTYAVEYGAEWPREEDGN